ncbi:MAG: BatD family protein [Opitutaceae bacterium]|jgi:hypothetical protein|nr:BatD family protein [Opitutaceae bacterium]
MTRFTAKNPSAARPPFSRPAALFWSAWLPSRMTARRRPLPAVAALVLAFVLAPIAHAQTVRWDPSGGSLAQGQTSQIRLVFENCKPLGGKLSVPDVPGLAMQYLGTNTSTSISINNTTRSTVEALSFTYAVRPSTASPVAIPSFTVETDKGHITVPPAQFSISPPAANATRTLDSVVTGRFDMPKEAWAGSVFPFTYTVNVSQQFYNSQNYPQWTPDPLIMDSWREPKVEQGLVNGEPRNVYIFSNRALARQPGSLTLNPASQIVKLNTGRRASGPFGMLGFDTSEAYEIQSDTPSITVKPLPLNAPPSFTGAVGQFILDSKIVPQSVKVGEPITWTLTLTGTGNWPDIPNFAPRDVSKAFHAITSQPKRTIKEGTLFEGELTQDIVLVPTEAGAYTLGPINWTYFEPAAGEYKTIHIPLITLDVAASASPNASARSASDAVSPARGAAGASAAGVNLPAPPPAPAAIPRDPLPGLASAPVPVTNETLLARALAGLAIVPRVWMLMALKRARRTDPARPRREARRRLARTLRALDDAADREETARLLQAWQRDTAILWQLPQAVPAAENLRVRNTPAATAWADLWAESDRVLYAARAPHSPDWTARAAGALAAARLPGFNPLSLLRPRNLLPFLSLLLVFLLSLATAPGASAAAENPKSQNLKSQKNPNNQPAKTQSPAAAAQPSASPAAAPAPIPQSAFRIPHSSPAAAPVPHSAFRIPHSPSPAIGAHNAGDFAAAERHWRDRLSAAPTDWIAHHNLALALAQQNQWAESAAHAAAAFVQNPSDPSVRWHLPVMMERAGYAPPVLVNFARPDLMHAIAARRSAPGWQCALLASVALAAAALILLLARGYALRKKLILVPAAALLLLLASALGIAISVISLCAWSPAADTRTVIVWQSSTLRSIPTDADTAQKTTPLPAGSVAIVDKTFLGWSRLVFENGQTGWTRQEVFVPLWK